MPKMPGNHSPPLQEAIRRRATELYQRSGAIAGRDAKNQYQGEAEILRESTLQSQRRAVVVNIDGVADDNSTFAAPTEENSKPTLSRESVEWGPGHSNHSAADAPTHSMFLL